jgi:hypothetical protein
LTTTRFVLGLLALGTASAQVFEIEGRYWFTKTNSQIRMERFAVTSEVDLKKDLGVSDQGFSDVKVSYSRRRSRFTFEFTPIRYAGDQNVNRAIVFHGRSYTAGTRVISNIDMNYLRFSWSYFFLNAAEGRLRIGSLLEGNGFLQNLTLKAPALAVTRSDSLSVGAPAVGFAGEYSPRRLVHIRAEVAGISVGRYGYFLRSEAGVKLTPARYLEFTAGYRTFRLNADYRPDSVQSGIRGPFVGAGVRF